MDHILSDEGLVDRDAFWEPCIQEVTVANTEVITSIGRLTIDIQFIDMIFKTSFIVLKHLFFDAIIGLKFLGDNDIKIDTGQREVYFKDPNIGSNLSEYAHLVESVSIPGYSKILSISI